MNLNVAEEEFDEEEYARDKRRALKRKLDYQKKKRSIDLTDISMIAGWTDDKRSYVHKRKNSTSEQWHKRASNRKVRRYDGDLSDPADYRKVYDLWWNLW